MAAETIVPALAVLPAPATGRALTLTAPLGAAWTPQWVRLVVAGTAPGAPIALTLDGAPLPCQFTGRQLPAGAEVLCRLDFAAGQRRELRAMAAGTATTDLSRRELPLTAPVTVGYTPCQVVVPVPVVTGDRVAGPFAAIGLFPQQSAIACPAPFTGATLAETNRGPLFSDYELVYRFSDHRHYTLTFRCYREEPCVEVGEHLALRLGGELSWTLNPERTATHLLSHGGFEFEGDGQPTVQALGEPRTRDILCRLQMPPLGEWVVPNNRLYFAAYDERAPAGPMLGVMGLYGDRWRQPVDNIIEVLDADRTMRGHASLATGARHFLLYAGPRELGFTSERRFLFHRLHAEFNACRLDEHLDLTGEALWDSACADAPCVFPAGDVVAQARARHAALPGLQRVPVDNLRYQALLDPTAERLRALHQGLVERFRLWVRQFQGWRRGQHDYAKNVIGFSRALRGLLLDYEFLRRQRCLTPAELGELNGFLAFAARRMTDEGRWPHSRTWRHPDHPESTRDLYTYGGEHKPDRLVWTNCLPNFQSDPMAALAHLSALIPEHPDASAWRRYALDDIDRQLDAYCGRSGAWEESINYALYTLSYFIITFRALKQRLGIDYFQDERVRRYVGWLCRFMGPYDRRVQAHTWPGLGNSSVPSFAGEYFLAFAGELPPGDPLRAQCLAIYHLQAAEIVPGEHYPRVLAAMAPLPLEAATLAPAASEVMDEVGVSLRHRCRQPDESLLTQKIGFAKDHYEGDETAFDWYAKGTPIAMDYGTYTGDIAVAGAHNLVEIPDEDNLRRGYLADHCFTPAVDYTRCELPVTLKLLWGRVRTFAEVDDRDGKVAREKTPYFYIGDPNPVGPKTWKVRLLLFVKPDYVALCDRVYGEVPHRYNLHLTAEELREEGDCIVGRGRFDLDPLLYIQHPARREVEFGTLRPKAAPVAGRDRQELLRQDYLRLYNRQDGLYRTLLFARERGREVRCERVGECGIRVQTPEYTDYVFLHNEPADERHGEVRFVGRVGWIRRASDGRVTAVLPDGEAIGAFGHQFTGRGPWQYNLAGDGRVVVLGGPPRPVHHQPTSA
jgi:hypothetical protein